MLIPIRNVTAATNVFSIENDHRATAQKRTNGMRREKWSFVHVNCSKAQVDCITCLTAKKARKIKLYERHLAKLGMDNKFQLLGNLRCAESAAVRAELCKYSNDINFSTYSN